MRKDGIQWLSNFFCLKADPSVSYCLLQDVVFQTYDFHQFLNDMRPVGSGAAWRQSPHQKLVSKHTKTLGFWGLCPLDPTRYLLIRYTCTIANFAPGLKILLWLQGLFWTNSTKSSPLVCILPLTNIFQRGLFCKIWGRIALSPLVFWALLCTLTNKVKLNSPKIHPLKQQWWFPS